MCGICGYLSENRLEDSTLVKMRDTMVHRGPDDAGILQINTIQGHLGLAHRRLSIFDLSEMGHQPMVSPDGKIAIVFNGEIYNFRDIRNELAQIGYSFKSECDTEVIMYSYDKWKESCFSKFNGMFAIAIWDNDDKKLIIARDRMGVKPLYYYWNRDNGDFVFGSELKPIMNYPNYSKNIDFSVLGGYLCYKYIAAPKTIFQNTYKMEPGTYGVYKDGKFTIYSYWDVIKRKLNLSKTEVDSFEECKELLNNNLTDAINRRMIADVPVGLFLSSGIDSALITAIAQKNSSNSIKTFTIGFNENERNEADKAKKIAEYLGTDHTELYIGDREIFDMIEDICKYYDEPFADSSQLPTMLVSKLASESVTVALSGDGGDELFCGYKMYDLEYIAQKVDWIGHILYHFPMISWIQGILSPEIRALINNRGDFKTQLFIDVTREQVDKILLEPGINPKHSAENRIKLQNWQERRMLLDMCTYLPDDIMAKTDRASMKYSLEVRSPLLDYRVVETSLRIPHKYKYMQFDKKHILKELAYEYIPKELLSGPKRGFGVPLAKWLRGPLHQEIKRYSDDQFLKRQGLFNADGVRTLIRIQKNNNKIVYSSILWSYYIFQRWWEEYLA